MIRSGFFNSINGDRKYDAGRFAEYFNSFIGNGVFPNPSTNLQVISSDNMSVIVRPGRAWINGYILINDDDYILQVDPADGILNRIDRVVVRYDVVGREIRLEVKKGSFASDPVPPNLQRDSNAYELAIAEINVNAGIISITQSNITDLRLNTELCGIVHGTIEQVDTTTLFNQYENWYTSTVEQAETDISDLKTQFQSDFNAWFETIQGILDEDTAGNLLSMINEINDKITENKDPIIITLNEGENEIISNVVTPLEVAKYPSHNVLGDLGDFEDLNEWEVTGDGILLDSNNKVFGDSSLKIAPINPDFISSVTMDIELDHTKYYMLSTYQKSNKSLIGSGVTIYSYNQDGSVSEMLCKIDLIQSDNFIRVGDVFNGAENITIFIETIGDIDLIAYFDGLMINEITQEEYDKIQAGTLTIDELLQLYPYVGDLNNAIITHQETGSSYNIGKKSGSIYLLEGNNTLSLEGISSIDISYEQNLKGVIYKNVKNISKVTSQLASTKFNTDMDTKQLQQNIRLQNRGALKKVTLPIDFTWQNAPVQILSDGKSYVTYFDVAKFKNTGGVTYYVDSVNGLPTNDGLSESTAFNTLNLALTAANDGDTIMIIDELLNRQSINNNNIVITKNINIIGKTKTVMKSADKSTFVKTAGYTNVYEVTRSNVIRVVDYAKKFEFTKVNSIAEVDATAGTYYTDNVKVYIHTLESTAPTDDVHFPLVAIGQFITIDASTRDVKVYFENVEIVGGNNPIKTVNSTTTKPSIFMKNSGVYYSYATDKGAIYAAGCDLAIFQNVEVAYCYEDGFDYHPANGIATKFIEINCKGHSNGRRDVAENFNGSTAHQDCKGIRIGGFYYNNIGTNISDVQGVVQSVNYNVTSFDSAALTWVNGSFSVYDNDMWLFNCVAFGGQYDIYAGSNGTMYVDDKTVYFTKYGSGTFLDIA